MVDKLQFIQSLVLLSRYLICYIMMYGWQNSVSSVYTERTKNTKGKRNLKDIPSAVGMRYHNNKTHILE